MLITVLQWIEGQVITNANRRIAQAENIEIIFGLPLLLLLVNWSNMFPYVNSRMVKIYQFYPPLPSLSLRWGTVVKKTWCKLCSANLFPRLRHFSSEGVGKGQQVLTLIMEDKILLNFSWFPWVYKIDSVRYFLALMCYFILKYSVLRLVYFVQDTKTREVPTKFIILTGNFSLMNVLYETQR
jgi:hypothetical protein